MSRSDSLSLTEKFPTAVFGANSLYLSHSLNLALSPFLINSLSPHALSHSSKSPKSAADIRGRFSRPTSHFASNDGPDSDFLLLRPPDLVDRGLRGLGPSGGSGSERRRQIDRQRGQSLHV